MWNMTKLCVFSIIISISICIDFIITKNNYKNFVAYREEWKARPPIEDTPRFSSFGISTVVIHETGGSMCDEHNKCIKTVQKIQNDHMNNNDDIIFNFLIGGDGYIYEGRGWYRKGVTVDGYSELSLSMAFIGNFTDYYPTPQAWDAFRHFLYFGQEFRYLSMNYFIVAHQQFQNIRKEYFKHANCCPGEKLFKLLTTLTPWSNCSLIVNETAN